MSDTKKNMNKLNSALTPRVFHLPGSCWKQGPEVARDGQKGTSGPSDQLYIAVT